MIRTQLYLPKTQLTALRKAAQKQGTTVSGVVRLMIEENILTERKKKPRQKLKSTLLDALEDIKKLGEKGPPDLAQNMDKYYYGNI